MECQLNKRLAVHDLHVDFKTERGVVHAVKGVDIQIRQGRIAALVGESGSGKSVTSLAIMGLLPENGKMVKGDIIVDGIVLNKLSARQRRQLNGSKLGMIFQNPSEALDPLFTVGDQLIEGMMQKRKITRKEARAQSINYLETVNLPDPETLMKRYPFELSGGMCQRVMIAMTIALQPSYLIADEPTTALDVTVQKQILSEIYRLSRQMQMGVLFITHDLGVVAEIADDVYIMQEGKIVENGDVDSIFHAPSHAYTKQLLDSIL